MIEIAKRAALEAGEIAVSFQGKLHSIKRKGTADNFSTEADIASEKKILEVLKSAFPDHNFLSEEAGREDNGSVYTWVIDPIDGTTMYASELPFYGISIGLFKDNKPYLGVLNLPALKALYWAVLGEGAYKNDNKIKVSSQKELSDSILAIDWEWMGDREKEAKDYILPFLDKVKYAPSFGSVGFALCLVAEGKMAGYFHWAFPWDFAAGALIIEEAGGRVTDHTGKPLNWLAEDMRVLATNGLIHHQIIFLINILK